MGVTFDLGSFLAALHASDFEPTGGWAHRHSFLHADPGNHAGISVGDCNVRGFFLINNFFLSSSFVSLPPSVYYCCQVCLVELCVRHEVFGCWFWICYILFHNPRNDSKGQGEFG